jgi:hypothetical protein
MGDQTVATQIASLLSAIQNCEEAGNQEWKARHLERLRVLERNFLPSGAGFDRGTTLDRNASTPEKLVFDTAFHHMNDNGYYTEWTAHTVTVRASLHLGISVRVSGRDVNGIKSYIHETFWSDLQREVSVFAVDNLVESARNKGSQA